MADNDRQSSGPAGYRDWIGRECLEHDTVALQPVRRLLATLDDTDTQLNLGDPLPPLWHWLFFLPEAPQRELGADGHPPRGGFLPPVPLPRRMWAGGRLRFHRAVPIGTPLRRLGRVAEIAEKTGRTGPLVFATVDYRLLDGDELCIEERQEIVYRDHGPPLAPPEPAPAPPQPPAGAWTREVTPDPRLLFRYSALTFNAHRIHYDRSYTVEREGYPALVVHGPLIATLLLDLVRRNSDRAVAQFDYRAKAPIFDTHPFRLLGVPHAGERVALTAIRCDGAVAMSAEALLR